jgi:FkbM family methyltransferase
MAIKTKDHGYHRAERKYQYYLLSILELITQFKPMPRIISLFAGLKGDGTCIITLRRLQLSFEVRSAMDVWSIKETFIDRFYEKYGCSLDDGWVVIDIGGGIGDFSVFASYNFAANKVYAFEPYPGSFDLLVGNLKRNQVTNVHAFQEAIWSSGGKLSLDTSTGEPVQFISREVGIETADSTVNVPCSSLQETMARLEIKRCDLLKIDAEGAEYAILFNTPEVIYEKIDRIVMEYHDAITQHTHTDLVQFLQAKGYRVNAVENAVHPELGYIYAER